MLYYVKVKRTLKKGTCVSTYWYLILCSDSDIKKEQSPPSPDDVIVLSDNEPSSPLMNGHCFTKTDTDKLMVGTHISLFLLKLLSDSL